MIVGPIVEGRSEERAIPKLLDKLNVRHRSPYVAEGKQDLLRRARDYAELQLSKGASHILFCFDADGPDGERDLARLQEQLVDHPISAYVPVHALEAWLLADEDALGKVLNRKVERISRPEEDSNPVRTLDQLFRSSGKSDGYLKTRHAVLIAECASDKALLRCPSYRRSSQLFRSGGPG